MWVALAPETVVLDAAFPLPRHPLSPDPALSTFHHLFHHRYTQTITSTSIKQ
jgi:hypothetical protein